MIHIADNSSKKQQVFPPHFGCVSRIHDNFGHILETPCTTKQEKNMSKMKQESIIASIRLFKTEFFMILQKKSTDGERVCSFFSIFAMPDGEKAAMHIKPLMGKDILKRRLLTL